jgi:starch phosphorylase
MTTPGPSALPPRLAALAELAIDLRWTWSHDCDELWRAVDPAWEAVRNPWLVLQGLSTARIAELAADDAFCARLEQVARARLHHLATPGWGAPDGPGALHRAAAYFSMEYGFGSPLPLFAGGLGVLAADHLKTACDLDVPLVGVGLLYHEGYFHQLIDADGHQEALYPSTDPMSLPVEPARSASGDWVRVPVELPGRAVHLRVWRAIVGRRSLYLLDSNDPFNAAVDRGITSKLYGGGDEMRLRQELVLGIGGHRALEALGLEVGVCHLNEGHAAFVVLERARAAVRRLGLSFREAFAGTRAGNVFTTHTPVTAGFDAFDPALMARYFPDGRGLLAELSLPFRELLALGRAHPDDEAEPFKPAYLAVRGSGAANGVSALHGEVSRRLFQPLFPGFPAWEVPVTHVTNGVHTPTWDSRWADVIWTEACGKDRWRAETDTLGADVAAVSDETLWSARGNARRDLVRYARARMERQLAQRGAPPPAIEEAAAALDPDVLTIGFARRFATYKRPNLLLRQPERLERLLSDRARPVQILVAGKAHPDDDGGKRLVEEWVAFVGHPRVRARAVFLEDYDLELAQEMVQGVDLWINTPRRPWEACGTSGMKVLVNGGLNLSVLDGWWAEAYGAENPDVGWAIGERHDEGPLDDAADTEALFALLETQIVPLFYDRGADGLPRRWLSRVRASLSRLAPRFSANRMLREYVERLYQPADAELERRLADGGRVARDLARRERALGQHFPQLRWGRLDASADAGDWKLSVEVYLDDLARQDVAVELFAAPGPGLPAVRAPMVAERALPGTAHGQVFSCRVPADRPAEHFTPRVLAVLDGRRAPLELPLVSWHH